MPREQITFEKFGTASDGPAKITLGVAHVSWERQAEQLDGHVQLALEVPLAYAKLAIDSPNGRTSDHTNLYTDSLSRAELNKLIRVLKRARDAAYGAAE